MPQLKSSNLDSAEYDAETRQMTIRFKGGTVYTYEDVDQATYDGLMTAPSPGSYFVSKIRDVFGWTKG
jgi:hypothetical protein